MGPLKEKESNWVWWISYTLGISVSLYCAQTDARTCERRAVFCLDRIRKICFADFSENLQHGNRVQRVPRARWHAVVMGGPWTQGHLRLSTLNRCRSTIWVSVKRSSLVSCSVKQQSVIQYVQHQIFKYCHAMSTNIEIFTHSTPQGHNNCSKQLHTT